MKRALAYAHWDHLGPGTWFDDFQATADIQGWLLAAMVWDRQSDDLNDLEKLLPALRVDVLLLRRLDDIAGELTRFVPLAEVWTFEPPMRWVVPAVSIVRPDLRLVATHDEDLVSPRPRNHSARGVHPVIRRARRGDDFPEPPTAS